MIKTIAILGSTGSIGTQTLDVVRTEGDIRVAALSAGKNIALLEKQMREFSPYVVSVESEKDAEELRAKTADLKTEILFGMDGMKAVATCREADLLVNAVVGMIGIEPTLEAIRAGKDIALANKESLVAAGHLIMPLAAKYGVRILPVDSEHSAVFQCLGGEKDSEIEKLYLTASGGPFRGKSAEELRNVTVEEALKHPTWKMGRKITIDSATLVNKGLEVMEARWLFSVPLDKIEVLIQPQSIIHSMVQFTDGTVMAQLGEPDMRMPIRYALYYPERRPNTGDRLDFAEIGSLSFEKPDFSVFCGLDYAYEAAGAGGSMPTVFNAANERAVSMFLNGAISFTDIYEIIRYCMDRHRVIPDPDLTQILDTEQEVYERIEGRW